jgi:hypothetical protein
MMVVLKIPRDISFRGLKILRSYLGGRSAGGGISPITDSRGAGYLSFLISLLMSP